MIRKISLRPYNGTLYYASTVDDYHKAHMKYFSHCPPDELTDAQCGRFFGGEGKDGYWAYLVWASKPCYLAHEMAHVVFHVFDRCGLDPSDSGGEAFCYLLSQLLSDCETNNG